MPETGRAELARQWAGALSRTAYVPLSRGDIEAMLGGLLDGLLDALLAAEFSAGAGTEAGRRLVAAHFTGEQSLSRTVEVLGVALPASPELRGVDGLAGKVVSLLGELASGYANALRVRTLDQQETVKLALLKASENARKRLEASEVNFRELFASSAVGIAISDLDGKLLEANETLGDIVGRPAAELVGQYVHELFHPEDTATFVAAYQGLLSGRNPRLRLDRQLRLLGKDGEPVWAYLAVSLLHDLAGRPTRQVTVVEDVTELHLLGDRLSHQSLHDALTGLPNQQFFVSTLESVVGRDSPSSVKLFKLDLDGFAVVNDGLGRRVGDQLLRSVAARLLSVVAGEKATVARFGADEFAILVEDSPTSPDVATLAERINTELAEPVYIDGNGMAVSACIGVVEHRGGVTDPAELLRAAETTLRRVKSGGTRQWGLFDPHRDVAERARRRLAATMPSAWENGEVGLEYQPLARLADGEIVGVEALLRWDHPERGPIPHRECLSLAEETGLVLPLGDWMLCKACEQLSALGWAVPVLHVNLTAQQSNDPDLVSCVRRALRKSGSDAARLLVGMPATALASDVGDAEDNVRALGDLGVAIALLEYGGAEDLARLEDPAVRTVRVAHGLVDRVALASPDDSLVAAAVPGLLAPVRARGITVIAADLRTRAQAAWWHAAGADVGQGRYLAPPGPLTPPRRKQSS